MARNCPFDKKYRAALQSAELRLAKLKPLDRVGRDAAEKDALYWQDKLDTLSIDHRQRGCICQGAPAGYVF